MRERIPKPTTTSITQGRAAEPARRPAQPAGRPRTLNLDALVRFAVEELDGEQSYRVLLQIVAVARKHDAIHDLADALRSKPHRVHGNYFEALLRTIQVEGSTELRDLIGAKVFAAEGARREISDSIVRMSEAEKLRQAARLGLSLTTISEEVIEQLVGALPLIAALYVASHAIGIGEVADLLGIGFLGKAGFDAIRDLARFYEVARAAQNEGDLRAAGAYLSTALATLGLTALLTLIGAAGRRRSARRADKANVAKNRETAQSTGEEIVSDTRAIESERATIPWLSSEQPLVDGKPVAYLNGSPVPPDIIVSGYHGTALMTPEEILRVGLPAKGSNWDLLNHAEQGGNSAFRGTSPFVRAPDVEGGATGAVDWADEGGVVVDIDGLPGWDVNAQLAGRVKTSAGYRGNLMPGEVEIAIPARVPLKYIRRVGIVSRNRRGHLGVEVDAWIRNPSFQGGVEP